MEALIKIKATPTQASKLKNAPKSGVFYTMGYFVRDARDGWQYIVEFAELFNGDYETLWPVYFTDEDLKNINN